MILPLPSNPLGIPKLRVKSGVFPVILAVALVPASKVVTVPIVIFGVWPFVPVGPCGPCSPWGPVSPLSPLSPFNVPASNLAWNVWPSLNVIWLALPVS